MRLEELLPEFVKKSEQGFMHVKTLAEADGLWFCCPVCWKANNGPKGTHHILCWFAGHVPDSQTPGPGRWTPAGKDFRDLTFVPGDPPRSTSIKLDGGCNAHFHIVNGDISGA